MQERINDLEATSVGDLISASAGDSYSEIVLTQSSFDHTIGIVLTTGVYNDDEDKWDAVDQFGKITSDKKNATGSFPLGDGALNTMCMRMINDPVNPYDCGDITLAMMQLANDWEGLYSNKGTEALPGIDFLDYFLELCGGKQYSGYSNHEYGLGNESSTEILLGLNGVTSTTSQYGYGYLEYAYKSFEFDPFTENDKYDVGDISPDQFDYYKNCLTYNGVDYGTSGGEITSIDGAKDWRNPYPYNSSADDDEVWDVASCGYAWYDLTNGIIADSRDENQECKAWDRLYTCINTDIDNDLNYYSDLSCGPDPNSDACENSIYTKLADNMGQIIDARENAIRNKFDKDFSTLSVTARSIGAYQVKEAFKTKYAQSSMFDNGTNVYNTSTGYNQTILSNFATIQNLMAGKVEIMNADATANDGSYSVNSAVNTTYVDWIASCLNKNLADQANSGSTTVNRSTAASWINDIVEKFEIPNYETVKTGSIGLYNNFFGNTTAISTSGQFLNTSNKLQYKSSRSAATSILNFGSYNQTVNVPSIGYKASTPASIDLTALNFFNNDCNQQNIDYVLAILQGELNDCRQNEIDVSLVNYANECTVSDNIKDSLAIDYKEEYKHYTLFYYDQQGNLVKTVPPQGVDDFNYMYNSSGEATQFPSRRDIKNHTLATEYHYNSLGQRTYEKTPDGGEKKLWYNGIGQLRFSQNAKQKTDGTYAYLKYDDLGRITESGLSTLDATSQAFANNIETPSYPNSNLTYRTVSWYDNAYTSSLAYKTDGSTLTQHYLQNRISYAYSDYDGTDNSGDENYTFYSYDPHGNVEWMLQSISGFTNSITGSKNNKHLAYDYDLVSGKITKVKYNEGMNDQFFYRYTYDSDGRIEKVETSRDNYLWDADVKYEYYAYGPLKRLSIGEDKIQGLDYIYTINGWLKAVNHPSLSSTYDPGGDGASTSSFPADVYGMTLGYFDGDFKRYYDADGNGNRGTSETTVSPFNSANTSTYSFSNYYNYQHEWYKSDCSTYEQSKQTNPSSNPSFASNKVNYRPLYNGTITNITYNQASTSSGSLQFSGAPLSFMYNYDELYRLTQASFDYYDASKTKWHRDDITSAYNSYKSSYGYDENGNIKTLNRYTYVSTSQFDALTYNYKDNDGNGIIDNNKLMGIDDTKSASSSTVDIDDQSSLNYSYDDIGELIGDQAEGISNIYWTPSGKVKGVTYTNGNIISFDYDALGNRVKKVFWDKSSGSYVIKTTMYVADANGKVMAIYESPSISTEADLVEIPLYGGDRIGELAGSISDDEAIDASVNTFQRTVGNKNYEIDDYLGNVRAIVSDLKGSSGANVSTSNDYYPYGMLLPGRNSSTSNYRYGYQGKEMDNELKSKTATSYDFGARMYDPRAGRWLSLDPLAWKYADQSPYNFCGNDPVNFVDPDGKETLSTMEQFLTYQYQNDPLFNVLSNCDNIKVEVSYRNYLSGSAIGEGVAGGIDAKGASMGFVWDSNQKKFVGRVLDKASVEIYAGVGIAAGDGVKGDFSFFIQDQVTSNGNSVKLGSRLKLKVANRSVTTRIYTKCGGTETYFSVAISNKLYEDKGEANVGSATAAVTGGRELNIEYTFEIDPFIADEMVKAGFFNGRLTEKEKLTKYVGFLDKQLRDLYDQRNKDLQNTTDTKTQAIQKQYFDQQERSIEGAKRNAQTALDEME